MSAGFALGVSRPLPPPGPHRISQEFSGANSGKSLSWSEKRAALINPPGCRSSGGFYSAEAYWWCARSPDESRNRTAPGSSCSGIRSDWRTPGEDDSSQRRC